MKADQAAETGPGPLHALVLAAGGSSRLGQPKQQLRFRGSTLLRRAVTAAAAVCPDRVTVVLGPHAGELEASMRGLAAGVVINPDWRQGLSASLRSGLGAVPEDCGAVLITLCDQPLVGSRQLSGLVARWRVEPGRIAASAYADTLGVPAVFPRALFGELAGLEGDRGARSLLRRHAEQVQAVPVPEAACDVDTPADLKALRRRLAPG